MIDALSTALAAAVLLAIAAPTLARRLPPATATIGLTAAASAVVAGAVYSLGVMAFTWIAQFPEVAEQGDWSPLLIRRQDPVPGAVAAAAALVLALATASLFRRAWLTFAARRRIARALSALSDHDRIVVVDSKRPDAYATPASGGRIVVTTGLLDALLPREHTVVIAHERAHLALRHGWFIIVGDLAAAANPMLRRTATAVHEATERWADERAAKSVGSRALAARALARAALVTHAHRETALAMAMVGGQMPQRVNALLAPPPRRRYLPLMLLSLLLLAVGATSASVEARTDHLFDSATLISAETSHHPRHP